MLSCPKCTKSMERVTFEGTTVDRCTGCYGIWFNALELDAIVRHRGARKLDIGSAEVGKEMDSTNRIDCPNCRGPMLRLVNSRHPDVRYEQCSACGGSFLDAGELRTLEERTLGELLDDLLPL